jgi:MFS family permease
MLLVAILAQAATTPGQTLGVSIFNPSFQSALGISISQLTGAYMIGTLIAAAPQPYIGGLMDRFGIRRVMTVVVIMLGLACIYTATVQSLWMLLIAFILLRMFGQGALSLLAANIPAMWFQSHLGRVSGLMNIGWAGATAILPAVILWMIEQFGWRWAYALLGMAVWIVLLPILVAVFRNRPEDIGQRLDGLPLTVNPATPKLPTNVNELVPDQHSFTLREAQHTPAYWIMFVYTALWAMIATGIFFNLLPYFTSIGLTETQAAATYTTLAIATAITQLVIGALADRVSLNWLFSLGVVCFIISLWMLIGATSPLRAHAYAIFMGLTQGFGGVVGGTLWARYYGREHLGKIRGSVFTIGVAGSSIGPFIMGLIYDNLGSYQLSLWIFMAMLIPVAIAALWAKPPKRIEVT